MTLTSILIIVGFGSYTLFGLLVLDKHVKLSTKVLNSLDHPFIVNITHKRDVKNISKERYREYLQGLTSFRGLLVNMLTWPLQIPTVKMLKAITEGIEQYDARNKKPL